MSATPIMIVSGGVGFSAEQLVQTALSQFTRADVTVQRAPRLRAAEQIAAVVAQAAASGALIVHTLVRADLRELLVCEARERQVPEIDLIGPLLEHLAAALGQPPLEQPGLYRERNKTYFDRIAAIEYTLAHDDGARPDEWDQGSVLLIGVSRVGKTPLSMYLAVLGWKVANLPLLREVPPPPELYRLERCRVVGLTIGLEQLIEHRRWRQRRAGMPLGQSYSDPAALSEELEESDRLFRRCGFPVVDVTSKPLESIANEVIAHVERLRA